MTQANREDWLNRAVALMQPKLCKVMQCTVNPVRVSIGWGPSGMGNGGGGQVLGETIIPDAISDGTAEVFVSPVFRTTYYLLMTLLHELIHAYGVYGHGKAFEIPAMKLGFLLPLWSQKMTQKGTAWLKEIQMKIGPYPGGYAVDGVTWLEQNKLTKKAIGEARLIVPKQTNDGASVSSSVITFVEGQAAMLFGGFTETDGCGGYVMQSGKLKKEHVTILDIAAKQNQGTALEELALQLKTRAKQESVYLRCPDGHVLFL